MSDIDRQRISGGEGSGIPWYVFRNGQWQAPVCSDTADLTADADAMHALLVTRADALAGCGDGTAEEREYHAVADVLRGYEAKRWRMQRGWQDD